MAWRASTAQDWGNSQPGFDGRLEDSPLSAKPARGDLNPRANTPDMLLDEARALANEGQHQKAIKLCKEALSLQGPDAATYYLMGVISQTAGNGALGETYFHKAVYLDPGHDEALLALALVAERRGEVMAAARFRCRAERASSRKGARER